MPAVRRCFTILQLNRSRGLVIDNDHCVADMIKETDWGTMIACIHATRKLNAFTRMLDSKTYVCSTWKGSINNDDMKNATNELQILVLVLAADHLVSRGAQCWPLRCLCVVFVCICPFCHHHHHAFVNFVALWWPAAMNPMFAKANRSVCYPNWIFAQPNLMFAQGPLSFLRWNIEH